MLYKIFLLLFKKDIIRTIRFCTGYFDKYGNKSKEDDGCSTSRYTDSFINNFFKII